MFEIRVARAYTRVVMNQFEKSMKYATVYKISQDPEGGPNDWVVQHYNTLNLGIKLLSHYHPNSGVTLLYLTLVSISLVSLFLSLSLLVRVSLFSEGLFILFLTKHMSHEMLHHVEPQIFFELLHMFDLV
jgi:hypothetical protein